MPRVYVYPAFYYPQAEAESDAAVIDPTILRHLVTSDATVGCSTAFSFNGAEAESRLLDAKVLACSDAADRRLFIEALQTCSSAVHVVAAAASEPRDRGTLRQAEVGLGLGLSGASSTNDYADAVLVDDSLDGALRLVMWGRCINDNVLRFIQFQLTVNVVCVLLSLIGAAANGSPPLNSVQLVWVIPFPHTHMHARAYACTHAHTHTLARLDAHLHAHLHACTQVNLIMDSFAAMALATELPTKIVMERGPEAITM